MIWKYAVVKLSAEFVIEMPVGACPFTIQLQYGVPTIWAIVDPDAPKEPRLFRATSTGLNSKVTALDRFLGTLQMHSGEQIYHVFEAAP